MNNTDLRKITMQMRGLYGMDDEYTFYYDETNNIRKFRFTDSGFNVDSPSNFVLAGIAHRGKELPNIDQIVENLKPHSNVKELKLRHLGSGDLLSILESEKIGKLFGWLKSSGMFVHYFNLNIIYWSIIDVVDSVLAVTRDEFFININMAIKSDLYKAVMNDCLTFIENAKRFNYPDVGVGNANEFVTWFVSFVRENCGFLDARRMKILDIFLVMMESVSSLPFLEGDRSHVLIDTFAAFYCRNIYMYPLSKHIFDNESSVASSVGKNIKNHGHNYQYTFVDSKTCSGVQVSDIIAGFLGKLFTYLRDSHPLALREIKSKLNDVQAENLRLLADILDRSDAVSNGFFCAVASEDEFLKINYFVHNRSMGAEH